MKRRHLHVYSTFQPLGNLVDITEMQPAMERSWVGLDWGQIMSTPGASACPSPHAAAVVTVWKGSNVLNDLSKVMLEVDCRAENWTKLKSEAMDLPSSPVGIQRWCLCAIQQLILCDGSCSKFDGCSWWHLVTQKCYQLCNTICSKSSLINAKLWSTARESDTPNRHQCKKSSLWLMLRQ